MMNPSKPTTRLLFLVWLVLGWNLFNPALLHGAQERTPQLMNQTNPPSCYDVVWNSPSTDYNGSMPLGNGEIGLNVWMEPSGDLLLYIGTTDSWDDNGRLLKLGRIRIKINNHPTNSEEFFQQRLNLQKGTIEIQSGTGEQSASLRVWVDACHPVIEVEIQTSTITETTASIELWRNHQMSIPSSSLECSDVLTNDPQQRPLIIEPDTLITNLSQQIGWYHHNTKSIGPQMCAQIQGLQDFPRPDPLLGRTCGAIITATRGQRISDTQLQSTPGHSHQFQIAVHTEHPATPQQWQQATEQLQAQANSIPLELRRQQHTNWWREFWNRSWITISSQQPSEANPAQAVDDAYVVSQAYALQRFINACAGRGHYPIKNSHLLDTIIVEVPYRK